jgi:hypothetical protein
MSERVIPKIISVDDHVVEPTHLFERWLPAKFRNHPDAPRVERRGIAGMKYLGGTKYDFQWTTMHRSPIAGSTKISSRRTSATWLLLVSPATT